MSTANLTLLAIVQSFCRRTGLTLPNSVIGNPDTTITQLYGLLEEEAKDLAPRKGWVGLTNQCLFTSVAAESQGTLDNLGATLVTTNSLNYILNKTFWDRTQRIPVWGPVSPQDWQALKAVIVQGPLYQYRIRAGTGGTVAELLMNPAPAAGHQMAFEYITYNWCLSTGTTPFASFTTDTDLCLLPSDIILMGLRWRWKKEKGFPYAEDMRTYETMVEDAGARDGTKPTLHMDDKGFQPKPGIWVPSGSWPVT